MHWGRTPGFAATQSRSGQREGLHRVADNDETTPQIRGEVGFGVREQSVVPRAYRFVVPLGRHHRVTGLTGITKQGETTGLHRVQLGGQ